MSKLKMFFLLFVLLSPALAFADCADGKYKDCRCSLAVNNGFQNVSDVTMAYCCDKGCGGMGYDGDPRCCSTGTTWDSATKTCKTACVSPKVLVNGVCKTPCASSCASPKIKNKNISYVEDGECCVCNLVVPDQIEQCQFNQGNIWVDKECACRCCRAEDGSGDVGNGTAIAYLKPDGSAACKTIWGNNLPAPFLCAW